MTKNSLITQLRKERVTPYLSPGSSRFLLHLPVSLSLDTEGGVRKNQNQEGNGRQV